MYIAEGWWINTEHGIMQFQIHSNTDKAPDLSFVPQLLILFLWKLATCCSGQYCRIGHKQILLNQIVFCRNRNIANNIANVIITRVAQAQAPPTTHSCSICKHKRLQHCFLLVAPVRPHQLFCPFQIWRITNILHSYLGMKNSPTLLACHQISTDATPQVMERNENTFVRNNNSLLC